MNALFNCTGKELLSNENFIRYLEANSDNEITVSITRSSGAHLKKKLYAYFNGPVIDACMKGLIRTGLYDTDEHSAELYLKSVAAKKSEEELWSKKDMPEDRLFQFVQASVHHIQMELEEEILDSSEFLERIRSQMNKEN